MGSTHGIGVKRNDYHRRNRKRNISMHKHSHGYNVGVGHLERIANTKIEVPVIDRDVLIQQATRQYNKTHARLPDTPISYSESIERICVNYIRHELSAYDVSVRRVGRDAYELLSQKVFDAIKEAYPWLTTECENQLSERLRTTYKANGLRLIKGGSLTAQHLEEFNEREEAAFAGVSVSENEDESGPLYGYDGALSSLDSERMLYFPPFLKHEEIVTRRFGDPEQMNDHWWEWEREQKLKTVTGRPRGTSIEAE